MYFKSIIYSACLIAILFVAMCDAALAVVGDPDRVRPDVVYQCKIAWTTNQGQSGMTPQVYYSPATQAGCFASAPTIMVKGNCAVGWPCNSGGNYTAYYIELLIYPFNYPGSLAGKTETMGTPTTCKGTFNLGENKAGPCS